MCALVSGVQTCALPIWRCWALRFFRFSRSARARRSCGSVGGSTASGADAFEAGALEAGGWEALGMTWRPCPPFGARTRPRGGVLGRASWRERAWQDVYLAVGD